MTCEKCKAWSEICDRLEQRARDAYNQAIQDAANRVKALSCGLDCLCDGCVARKNDVATILELRVSESSNVKGQR